jgi:hypothetical protein
MKMEIVRELHGSEGEFMKITAYALKNLRNTEYTTFFLSLQHLAFIAAPSVCYAQTALFSGKHPP